ncbi:uncharacterized protein YukE [Catenulispora sp. EB89]|uniref:WXG100 family type VII secretion target n=1 Tax=Catenulispora sp. EB89 TaxID=3156257 RepID=UPI003515AAEA
MTADQISVNFGALQASAGSLSTKAAALTSALEELLRNLQPMKQTWVESGSSAGVAADQAETKLRAATNDIIATINQFSAKVTEAHDLQYSAEQTMTGYFA